MGKLYIGIDNGVSGQIGFIHAFEYGSEINLIKTPTKKELSYTKVKQNITRIDIADLKGNILSFINSVKPNNILAIIERPMVNPARFKASASALRALEATLIVLESLNIPYRYIDSKEWQKEILPKGLSGDELKNASLDIGNRLFPEFKDCKLPDRDGILIAEYARRKNL